MDKSIHTDQYHAFTHYLRQCRLEANVSQVELAERLNTTQAFISKCERGERRLDIIETKTWVEALGIPFARFIQGFEDSLRATIGA